MTKLELKQFVRLVEELNDSNELFEAQHLDVVAAASKSGFLKRHLMEDVVSLELDFISNIPDKDYSLAPYTKYGKSFNYNL